MGKQLTDAEIMSKLLETLDISANKLATKLEYKSASSIYHVLDDNEPNKITSKMAEKIVEIYPRVNFMFLTRGEEPVLLEHSFAKGQANLFGIPGASFDDVPQTLKNIETLLTEIRDKMNDK